MKRLQSIIPFLYPVIALFILGCGGSSGGINNDGRIIIETSNCSMQDYNKSNLPPVPPVSSFDQNSYYYQQWAEPAEAGIHMDMNGTHRYIGRNVKVAVIDDGLDVTHEDLKDAVKKTYDVQSRTTNVQPSSDEENHGTEVAGVIAARNNDIGIVGTAPGVDIYFIRMPFGTGVSTTEIIDAFEKAKEWGADVINCSWGSNDVADSVKSAIVDIARHGRNGKGTIIVFAAGNDDQDIGNDESSIPEVIAVGSSNEDNLRSSYSNYGAALDVMAPGGEHYGITTLDQMGQAGVADKDLNYILYDDYRSGRNDPPKPFAGTSASAPIVTGVVAQLLEANPNLTRENVVNALECSADKIGNESYDQSGRNDYYGYGKINATNALNLVR